MSGVKRNIVADLARSGDITMEKVHKALSPENIRTEDGRADTALAATVRGDTGKDAPKATR